MGVKKVLMFTPNMPRARSSIRPPLPASALARMSLPPKAPGKEEIRKPLGSNSLILPPLALPLAVAVMLLPLLRIRSPPRVMEMLAPPSLLAERAVLALMLLWLSSCSRSLRLMLIEPAWPKLPPSALI